MDIRDEAIRLRKGVAAIVPGDAKASELVHRLFAEDPDDRMPPTDSTFALNEAEKQTLVRRIEAGAEYQEHWSFVSLGPTPLPAVEREDLVRTPIDRFILARLDQEGLSFGRRRVQGEANPPCHL